MKTVFAASLLVAGCSAAVMTLSCAGNLAPSWVVPQPPPSAKGQKLHIVGTVHYVDLEGGLFVIRDARGAQYNPTNLPEAFRRDGMLVEAEAQRRDDMVSIGMVGTIVELLRIRARSGTEAPEGGKGGAGAEG